MANRSMDMLKDMLCRELEEIAEKGELSAGDLDAVYKLAVAKEKLMKAEMLEEEMGYSNDDGMYSRHDGMRGDSMRGDGMRGDSYGRHYFRGHYSRNDRYDDGMMRR